MHAFNITDIWALEKVSAVSILESSTMVHKIMKDRNIPVCSPQEHLFWRIVVELSRYLHVHEFKSVCVAFLVEIPNAEHLPVGFFII